MKQDMRNSGGGAKRLISQLAAEKKKTVIALCLIALMGFMWVRVLSKKTPQSAEAALTAQESELNAGSNSESKICFTELEEVAGRNDVLTRDFFDAERWDGFNGIGEGEYSSGEEVSVVSKDGGEHLNRIAEKLKLQAIELGRNPQAFINDKLLSEGDKMFVKDGVNKYECEVVEIEENTVFIRCEDAEITLKLTQMIETDD